MKTYHWDELAEEEVLVREDLDINGMLEPELWPNQNEGGRPPVVADLTLEPARTDCRHMASNSTPHTMTVLSHRGFTLVELMIVVVILGLLAVIAVPALQKYMRKAKTAEARVQIAKIYDGASGYFKTEHVARGSTAFIGEGGGVQHLAPHLCPFPEGSPEGGEAGITPSLDINCNEGPGGRCVPSNGEEGKGHYFRIVWKGEVWIEFEWGIEVPHFFHYNFIADNQVEGYGKCRFTAQAFADLDDDGIFSTFERSGACDQQGCNGAVGLYLDREVE